MEKKVIIVISADLNWRIHTEELLKANYQNMLIYTAADGREGSAKIQNTPPNILILDTDITKVSNTQILNTIFKTTSLKALAVLLVNPGVITEDYNDELVTGRLHYIVNKGDDKEFLESIPKALNYNNGGAKNIYHSRLLEKDELLIKEGDKATFVFILKSGQLSAFHIKKGVKVSLGKIEPGEFVGEMASITGELRSANVEAVIPSEVIEIPIGTFESLLYKNPAWAKTLVHVLSKRLKEAIQNSSKSGIF